MAHIWTAWADRAQSVDESPVMRRALVVFSDQTGLWWLRFLRRGFRHCFAMIQFGEGWVLYNPLSNGTQIDVWAGVGEDTVRGWLEGQGFVVVEYDLAPLGPDPLAWAPFSCVEAVKRALRVRAGHVVTPWQLYRFLRKTIRKEKIP